MVGRRLASTVLALAMGGGIGWVAASLDGAAQSRLDWAAVLGPGAAEDVLWRGGLPEARRQGAAPEARRDALLRHLQQSEPRPPAMVEPATAAPVAIVPARVEPAPVAVAPVAVAPVAVTPPRVEPAAAPPIAQTVAARPPVVAPPRPAWLANAVDAPAAGGRPLVAVVIDDLGLDLRRTAETVALPGPLTLAWLPYARDLPRQTAAAREAGHELLVHLPMEPRGREYPGPNALVVSLSSEAIRERLAQALSQFPGFVGINNHMGSRFTADMRAMEPVIEELRARGLLFLDSRTTPSTVGPALADVAAMPHAVRDVFLDNLPFPDAVRQRLVELEEVARRKGHAIAIGHPHDATIEALRSWLREAPRRGFVLAPVSATVRLHAQTQVADRL